MIFRYELRHGPGFIFVLLYQTMVMVVQVRLSLKGSANVIEEQTYNFEKVYSGLFSYCKYDLCLTK